MFCKLHLYANYTHRATTSTAPSLNSPDKIRFIQMGHQESQFPLTSSTSAFRIQRVHCVKTWVYLTAKNRPLIQLQRTRAGLNLSICWKDFRKGCRFNICFAPDYFEKAGVWDIYAVQADAEDGCTQVYTNEQIHTSLFGA